MSLYINIENMYDAREWLEATSASVELEKKLQTDYGYTATSKTLGVPAIVQTKHLF